MESNQLYAVCTVLLPYMIKDCSLQERSRLRLVCQSWARAVDNDWRHKLQLNMIGLALDDLDDEKQLSLASYLSKSCTRVRELIIAYDEEPFGCSMSPEFWYGLRSLAPRLKNLVIQNVSITATRRFFIDFLSKCVNLESLTYRPLSAYGSTDFDDDEKNGEIVNIFSMLTKLKHLRLTIDYYQSDGGRFLTTFATAKELETFDVRHFKLSYYRTFNPAHVATAIKNREKHLHTFRTTSYLDENVLNSLVPTFCSEVSLRELEFILEGRSLTYDNHFEIVRSAFERMRHLRTLRVRTSGCLFVDVGSPFDPKILFEILNSCTPRLTTFHFDHVHALMRKRTDRYALDFASAMQRFSPCLRELRLNVARVCELSILPWNKMIELRCLILDECNLFDYTFLTSIPSLQKLVIKPTSITRRFFRDFYKNIPTQLEELVLSSRDYAGEDGYESRLTKEHWMQLFSSKRLRYVTLVQVDAAVSRNNYVRNVIDWAKTNFPKISFKYRTQNSALLDRHL